MSADGRNKDKAMAGHLKSRGIPHGRRMTAGLNAVPSMADVGSAAYRRRTDKSRASVVARDAKIAKTEQRR